MNGLEVFTNEQFGTIRTIVRDDNPWFVAVDICQALEIGNSRQAVTRLDEDEKFTTVISNDGAASGVSSMTFINEPGLYTLVLGSRKPEARAFRRWITHDVIPALRKHGVYATPAVIDQILADPDFAIRTFTALKEERAQRKALESQIKADEPYTDFAKSIANSSDSIHIGDFAKLVCNSGINIGRTRLFRWLRERQYLMNDNKPYQRYVDQDLFKVKESCIHTVCGSLIKFTTLVTGKGQMVLLEALKEEFGERLPCGGDAA